MDKIIQLATVLFILSLIFERINEFLKYYLSGKSIRGWQIVGDTTTKFPAGSNEEKRREYRILKMNLVVGFITSILAHASFFDLLRNLDNPGKVVGWPDDLATVFTGNINYFRMPLQFLVGCLFTGAFISMGSKFWHDILDLLLYTKNMKAKLADPETYEVTSADQLTEYLSFTDADLVRLAIAQNDQILKTKFTNIRYLNDSVAIVNGERKHVLGIYLSDKNTNGLPETVPAKLPSGIVYKVNTEIIEGLGVIKIQGGIEGDVAHEDSPGYIGSACCILTDQDNNNLLLTNGHVLSEGNLDNSLFNTDKKKVLYNDTQIGEWYYSAMNSTGDFALVMLNDGAADNFNSPLFDKQTRDILKDDWLRLQATISGSQSKTKTGAFIIEVVRNQVQVEYRGGNTITIEEAILVGDNADKQLCKPVSAFGDSGGSVYDSNNKLIGIITASDDKFTYAVPLKKFFSNLHLEIK